MRVGQLEFLAIFALIVIAIVVIFFASQGALNLPTAPSQLTSKQEAVKNEVINFIRAGSDQALREISATGGLAYENRDFEWFTGKPVVYWQKNGQLTIPDLKQDLADYIQTYLEDNKNGFQEALEEPVLLGDPSVSVDIFDSKINVIVSMPTTIGETQMTVPYTVEIPTKIGEAYEFAKGFARQELDSRYIEYYLMNGIAISPFKDGQHSVPIYVSADQCNDFVYMDWWDIQPELKNVVKTTLAGIYMPGKVPLDTIETRSGPKFIIPAINGKNYNDLEISFHVPDDFDFDQETLQFTPNPITSQAEVIPFVAGCYSDPVYVQYSIRFPAIVRAKDPLTGNILNFAIDVFIKDNAPSSWTLAGYEAGIQELICSTKLCSAEVTVKQTNGNPIQGAAISFMGCGLGRTDSTGQFSGPAPCGGGFLDIHAPGYDSYSLAANHNTIKSVTATLAKSPIIALHFIQVPVSELNGYYRILAGTTKDVEGVVDLDMIYPGPTDYIHTIKRYEGSGLLNLDTGLYSLTAQIRNTETAEAIGLMVTNYEFKESQDGKSLYVYIPALTGYSSITDPETKANTDFALSELLEQCGYGPISTEEAEDVYCEKEVSSVQP